MDATQDRCDASRGNIPIAVNIESALVGVLHQEVFAYAFQSRSVGISKGNSDISNLTALHTLNLASRLDMHSGQMKGCLLQGLSISPPAGFGMSV
ncbi:hypothetical protein RRG08_038410 [Elysia crispata]|uniref:Uncharacterized protein n=1 Tax=Elysia crispata TaxID=231223 RepID=A0AAE1CZB2_9GAST|nr:hypothetical protein RRG08_038410 [Elysia crispata]